MRNRGLPCLTKRMSDATGVCVLEISWPSRLSRGPPWILGNLPAAVLGALWSHNLTRWSVCSPAERPINLLTRRPTFRCHIGAWRSTSNRPLTHSASPIPGRATGVDPACSSEPGRCELTASGDSPSWPDCTWLGPSNRTNSISLIVRQVGGLRERSRRRGSVKHG